MLARVLSRVPSALLSKHLFSFRYSHSPFDNNKKSPHTPFGPSTPFRPSQQSKPIQPLKPLNSTFNAQKITPLSDSKQPVETEIVSSKQPPELKFDLFQSQSKRRSSQAEDQEQTQVKQEEPAIKHVMSHIGLNHYLSRVYATTGISLAVSIAAAYAGIFIPNLADIGVALAGAAALLSYFGFKSAYGIRPQILTHQRKGQQIIRTNNSVSRIALHGLACIFLGLSASPLFAEINEISLSVLPLSLGITASIFGGASLLGLAMPRNAMLGYGSVLFGGLLGLMGLNVVLLASTHIWGVTLFTQSLASFQSCCGIALFTGFLMYDTHVAIRRYQQGDADHLGMSIQMLLDLWNLIIRIAKHIAEAKAKQANKK